MQDNVKFLLPAPGRYPGNKGKLIGAGPPLRQKFSFDYAVASSGTVGVPGPHRRCRTARSDIG